MRNDNFKKMLQIIKSDDRYDFNEELKEIIDQKHDECYSYDVMLMICFAAEIGSVRIFEMLTSFDGVNEHAFNDYSLKVAIANGHNGIIDVIDPGIDIAIEEIDKNNIVDFNKKIKEKRDAFALDFEIAKDKISEMTKAALAED